MANGDEKVLSQSDVDALVALVPDAPRVAPEPASAPAPAAVATAPPPPPKPVEKTVHVPAPAPEPVHVSMPAFRAPPANNPNSVSAQSLSEVVAMKKTIEELSRQVAKFTATAQRLDQLEERIGQVSLAIQNTSHGFQPAIDKISRMEAELDDLEQQTAHRHELRDDFVCEKCDSRRTMAILTKCTSCGQERWFGWWPRKSR
jgi:hypothetical protein